jgi:pimeloyl-ACP methyl ester carboxylesterase
VKSIVVPENRRGEGGKTLELRVRMLGRADAPALFHLTGGPGMSNLAQRYPRGLLERFRIVEVGYRGIDSTPALDGRLLGRVLAKRNLSTSESKAALADAFRASLEAWRSGGIDPSAYQMRDLVGDLEDVRTALRLGRVHVVGQSYGTRVALHWMTEHPEAIHRAVLIGANPPGCFFWPAAGVRRVFDAYQAHYPGDGRLESIIAERVASLPSRWLGIPIDRDRIRILTFFLLFHRETARRVFGTYLRGSTARFALASIAMGLAFPRMGKWGDFFLKGLCADFDPKRDYAAETRAEPQNFGSPLGDLLFTPPWDASSIDRDPPRALDIRTPTLILSGALDFSTPPENARVLTEKFPSVVQRVEPDKGHVMDFWREPVIADVLSRFLLSGDVPNDRAFPRHPIRFG